VVADHPVVGDAALYLVKRRDHLMRERRRDGVRVGEALQDNNVPLAAVRLQ
jgi:hypothetical protein